jgi:hypothetical protein
MTVQNRIVTGTRLLLLLAATGVVCLAQMPPIDSGDYAAKVLTLTGQVSVLKDSMPWALEVGDQVLVKQLILTGPDGQATFQVSDGSTFVVYPNSRVVFRKNAPNWKDLLDVLVGRVKVHIEHLYGPNPNRVLTPTAVISVRGTTFEISVEDDDETTLVEVEEGMVEVQHALLPRGAPRTLGAGESLHVYRNEPLASNVIDKRIIFRQVFRMAMDAISTWESRIPRGSVGGGSSTSSSGSGGGCCADTTKPAPPSNAPPPPPPVAHVVVSTPGGTPHIVSSNGHMMLVVPSQPVNEGRWHRVTHAVLHSVRRFVLGADPGADVLVFVR